MESTNFTFRLKDDLRQALTKIASQENRSIASVLNRIIIAAVKSAARKGVK